VVQTQAARTRRTLLVGVAAVVVVLAAAVAAVAVARAGAGPAAQPGAGTAAGPVPFDERVDADERAPLAARTLEGFGGGPPVDLTAYRGRPLVVNFWATWCDPCVKEMPGFQRVWTEVADEVAFLGVDVADGPRQAEPVVAELGISYDLARDPDRTFATESRVYAMPTTLFVDAEGTIVHRATRDLDEAELREALRTHLGIRAGDQGRGTGA
jgi:thiol-disulfide isomerase/thioredoxin